MNEKKQDDNWDLLASELGIESNLPLKSAPEEELDQDSDLDSKNQDDYDEIPIVSEWEIRLEEERAAKEAKMEAKRVARRNKAKLKEQAEQNEPAPEPAPSDSFGAGLIDEVISEPLVMPQELTAAPVEDSAQTATAHSVEKPVEEVKKEGRRSFFGRFPKMNLFGSASPKDALESVVEDIKTPSLSGKSFTSKTMEKLPIPTTSRRVKESEPAAVSEPKTKADSDSATPSSAADPWTQIVSQVDSLSGNSEPTTRLKRRPDNEAGETPTSEAKEPRLSRTEKQPSVKEGSRRGRPTSTPPSIFDIEEPLDAESLALKNLIEEPQSERIDEAQRIQSIFGKGILDDDEDFDFEPKKTMPRERTVQEEPQTPRAAAKPTRESRAKRTEKESSSFEPSSQEEVRPDSRREGRGRGRSVAAAEPKEFRGSNSEVDSDFEPAAPQGRGRASRPGRGSRYGQEASIQDRYDAEDSFSDSAWDADEGGSKPVERSSRGTRRRTQRAEPVQETERSRRYDDDDQPVVKSRETAAPSSTRSLPSWDDAIGMIVESNVQRHGRQQSPQRRTKR